MSTPPADAYHFWGVVSSALFCVSLFGIASQLRIVWQRAAAFRSGALTERPTAVLSVNRTTSSFIAFFANYLLAITFDPVDPYLFGTRLIGLSLVLATLYQIAIDRRDRVSRMTLVACTLFWAGATLLTVSARELAVALLPSAQVINVLATVVLTQGYLHQIAVIRRTGSTGAVSKLMFQLLVFKEISTAAFAWSLPIEKSWPILLLSSTALLNELLLLWHFRWVRVSSLAAARRQALAHGTPRLG